MSDTLHVICTEGADAHRYVLDGSSLYSLVLLLGNGLEGDVRFTGNTADAVDAARGLIIGTGNCHAIDAAEGAPLYRLGDECYRQHEGACAFLDPKPTGEVVGRKEARLTAADCVFWSSSLAELGAPEERNQAWSFGPFEIPKSTLLREKLDGAPTYRRGCLTYALEESSYFIIVPFERPDGPAVAMVLHEPWEDHFAGWGRAERQVELGDFAAMLNAEIAAAWRRWK